MKKKHLERIAEINQLIRDVKDKAQSEKRDFSDQEKEAMNEWIREKSYLLAEVNSIPFTVVDRASEPVKAPGLVQFVRDALDAKGATSLQLMSVQRAETTPGADPTHFTADLGAVQPLTVGDIVNAVEEKLVWKLLGIQMPTGLSGRYEWPVVGDVEATFAGEGVDITPVKVNIDKVPLVPQPVRITMDVTRQSVINSDGKIRELVLKLEPEAIARAINNVVLSPSKVAGQNLEGPFVGATAKTVAFDFKGLNGAKAALLAKGYDGDSLVWVMDAATRAELEATPKDAGSGIMVIEDGLLCGRPVFTASVMDGKIGLGDFRYQVVGQVGTPELIVDPYTKATAGKVRITTQADFGTATLSKEAFMILTRKA